MSMGRGCGRAGIGLILAFMFLAWPALGQSNAADPQSGAASPSHSSAAPETAPPTRYTLPPQRRAQAVAYAHTQYLLYFFSVALALGTYYLMWRARLASAFRNWARRASPRLGLQCLVFAPLFFLSVSLIEFPLDYYSGFVLERRFGLSHQTVASWLGDWGKALGISIIVGIFALWILYAVIRRSPRRWWFYFWLVTLPLIQGLVLIQPLVIDPLFYKFTPLAETQPALTARIEAMLAHAGLQIPPSRIFLMNASSKTGALNAYVNGVGGSMRVVVWDTTLRQMGQDEILLVLGHEAGHYILGHIVKGFALFELGALAAFAIGFLIAKKLVVNLGGQRGVEGMGDLAALPIFLFVITFLSFLSSPVYCAFSRHFEHQADQFGLEVAYGVVADPNAAEARSLEILGSQDLEDPAPSPFIKFWLYTHPPLDERIRFAASYKPWAEGKPMELLPPK